MSRPGVPTDTLEAGRAHLNAAMFFAFDDETLARHHFERSVEIARRLDHRKLLSSVLYHFGSWQADVADYGTALRLLEQALAIDESEFPDRLPGDLIQLGFVLCRLGDLDAAEQRFLSALAILGQNGDAWHEVFARINYAFQQILRNETERAIVELIHAHAAATSGRSRALLPAWIECTIALAVRSEDHAFAAYLFGALHLNRDRLEVPPTQGYSSKRLRSSQRRSVSSAKTNSNRLQHEVAAPNLVPQSTKRLLGSPGACSAKFNTAFEARTAPARRTSAYGRW
jgi:tetratricopeptide (TPR) repeat protein